MHCVSMFLESELLRVDGVFFVGVAGKLRIEDLLKKLAAGVQQGDGPSYLMLDLS